MRPESLVLESKTQTQITQSILQKLRANVSTGSANSIDTHNECLGGVIRGGQLGWIAFGAYFEVFSLKTGQKVAGHSFADAERNVNAAITCVAEVQASDINTCLLVVGVHQMPVGGLLYLFSVQGSRIIHRIDVIDKITSCCFINENVCKRGNLKHFQGCVAVGTDRGDIFLFDLHLSRCKDIIRKQQAYIPSSDESTCKIISAPLTPDGIRQHLKQARIERVNLGIKLDVSDIPVPAAVSSILSMPQMQMIAVGLEDGLLALFNISDMKALHLAYPPEPKSPLVKLTYLEPADDPRPCIYIWGFHANGASSPFAVMHSISFETKTYQDGENLYETFQWCRPDLTIPIHEKGSSPISCQSVTKIVAEEDDEQFSLCLLAWTNPDGSSFVLVFDLNQWYKEQMPRICDWREHPPFLAPFPIEVIDAPLDIWLNPKSVATFNSIQRPEEHFYPTSLSFDLFELTSTTIHKLHWAGLQNNAIQKLSSAGAIAILVPDEYFNEFLEASLNPLLSDRNYHNNPTTRMKQEFLMTMALENNCLSLLKECALQWADGSHMGPSGSEGLTLSFLTDWTWSQATTIKDRCNDLCVPLFDDSGITIDLRSRKILAHYSRQLKLLADLLQMILTTCRQYIPDEIFDTLCCQRNSIRMTSEYQEVLQWLLNMGLLPEIVWNQLTLPEPANDTFTAIPYPYRILNKYYTDQRQKFYDIDRANLVPKTNSCKCLYIDSFINRESNAHLIRAEWKNDLGDGLYPPPSLQAMLRILLVPGISLQNKYMLFVYLFLDLHMVLEDEHYYSVVQNLIKFPAVFKLNSSLIKTTQAFWNLDHNEYEIALKELVSPLTSDQLIARWQQELLINTLLQCDMPNLALQALRAPGPIVSTSLKIKTLLANDLVTEAFELQRCKNNEELLIEFFNGCHKHKKWNHVLSLSLTETEGTILCKFLQSCDTLLAENLHLLYLLQRNKYIDAITYLDNTKHKPRSVSMQRKLANTQDLIISSYEMAMNATDRDLTEKFLSIKDRLPADIQQPSEIVPLSSELNPFIVDTNANVVGSVFHRAILSAKRAGISYEQNPSHKTYIPLLSNPRIDFESLECNDYKTVVHAKPYSGQTKRRKEIVYEANKDPDCTQPAAKRQRTDSFSVRDQQHLKQVPSFNTTIPTSFKFNVSVQNIDEDDDELMETTENSDQRNSQGELNETINLLSTPVVRSTRKQLLGQSLAESRCQTPQSILKHRHTELGSNFSRRSTSPSLTVNSAKRSVDFNEKSFRYIIPSQQQFNDSDEYRLDSIQERAVDEEEDDDDENSNISPYAHVKGRPSIHSANESESNSADEEYFSPEKKDNTESPISHKAEKSAVSLQNVASRRRLRSATPDTSSPASSTRITRSMSKHSLDVTDNVDVTAENSLAKLNTSTPIVKSKTERRSLGVETLMKPLSDRVVEANALKTYLERTKAAKAEHKASEGNLSKSSDDSNIETAAETVQPRKNILDDFSFVGESFVKQHKAPDFMSDGSLVVAKEPQRNILEGCSSDASEDKVNRSSEIEESQPSVEVSEAGTSADKINETNEENEIEMVESQKSRNEEDQLDVSQVTDNTESNVVEVSNDENAPESNDNLEKEETRSEAEVDVVEEISDSSSSNEKLSRPQQQNILTDTSVVNESMMRKYMGHTSVYSTTSSANLSAVTSHHQKTILQDSSFADSSRATDAQDSGSSAGSDIVNIEDEGSNESGASKPSSRNTISSSEESEDFLYMCESSSDIEIRDDDYKKSTENKERFNKSNTKNDDDDIIQISSGSSESADSSTQQSSDQNDYENDIEEEEQAESDFGQDEDSHLIEEGSVGFAIAADLGMTSTQRDEYQNVGEAQLQVDEYNLTELQSVPASTQIAEDNREQAINEMIYGDLNASDQAEINDMEINNEAVSFGAHGDYREELNLQGRIVDNLELSSNPSQSQTTSMFDKAIVSDVAGETLRVETTTAVSAVEVTNVCDQALVAETISYEVTHITTVSDTITEPSTSDEVMTTESSEQKDERESEKNDQNVEKLVPTTETIDDEMQADTNETNFEPTNIFETAVVGSDTTNIEHSINEEPTESTNVLNQAIIESEVSMNETETVSEQMNVEENAPVLEEKSETSKPPTSSAIEVSGLTRRTRKKSESESASSQPAEVYKDSSKTPMTPKTARSRSRSRSRKAASQQDLTEIEQTVEIVEGPKSRSRKKSASESSDVEASEKKTKSSMRKAVSHQTLENVVEDDEMPSTSKASKTEAGSKNRMRRATSQQPTSSKTLGDSEDQPGKFVKLTRSKRSASAQCLDEMVVDEKPSRTLSRSKRSASAQSLSEESTDEKPARSLSRSKRAVSHQSLIESIKEEDDDSPSTSKSRKKTKSESSDIENDEKSSKSRMRKAVSHQTLSNIDEDEEMPSTSNRDKRERNVSSARPKRAASYQSLSSLSEESNEEPTGRLRRGKSVSSIASDTTLRPRTRRAASHQSLVEETETEKAPAKTRAKAKRESSQEPVNESVSKPRTRRAASVQSLVEEKEIEEDAPKSRTRKKLTKAGSVESLSVKEENTSPVIRSKRSTSKQPPSPKAETEKTPRKTRSSRKEDDAFSDTSSIVSTRSRKPSTADDDDDKSSVKSSKTKRTTRAGSALPAIAEDELNATKADTTASTEDLTTSRRLTRAQQATMEKYAKAMKETTSAETKTTRITRKRKIESIEDKINEEDEDQSEQSDTASLASNTSKMSKTSMASKRSKISAESSQRSTRSRSTRQ